MARRFFVGGNWKCNGNTASIQILVKDLNSALPLPDTVDVVVAPPPPYLGLVQSTISPYFAVSAQNCWKQGGAFTGEISPEMIKDFGLRWVILGHSERRHVFGETNETISEKTQKCLDAGLCVIGCVGELEAERLGNQTVEVVSAQMKAFANRIGENWSRVVIAYEPVWAIGTGRTATSAQAQEVHAAIRAWLKANVSADVAGQVRILYGGSVTPANCNELASNPDIDGFLVGGASLSAEKFVPIIKSVEAKK